MFDIRLPNITGSTEREQLVQVKSYLYQLAEQLQWALQNVDTSNNASVVMPTARSLAPSSGNVSGEINAQATFASIKSLIIKSAEIVDAYYDEINARLEGLYVAQSDFGTFVEETEAKFEATSKGITQTYTSIQTIESNVGSINTTVQTLESNVGGINTTIQTLGGAVQTIDSTVQTIDSTVETLGGTVQTLDSTIQTVDGKVAGVEGKVTGVESKVTEVEEKVSTVETEVGTVKDKVSTVEGEVSDVKGEVSTVKEDVKNVDGKVDTVKNDTIADIQDARVTLQSNIDGLSERVNSQSTAIQDVKDGTEKSIKDVGDRVDGLSGEIDGVKTDVDEKTKTLEEAIKTTNAVVATVTGTIKTGEIDKDEMGLPVYGLEIGQINEASGVVNRRYARFTADELSFYDDNNDKVAWISNNQLHITEAEVTGNLKIGGYLIDTSNGLAFKWVGR